MADYRRSHLPGGTFFLTLVTHHRTPVFRQPIAINALRAALRRVRQRYPFVLDGVVVLPDHLHLLLTLPTDDADFPTRVRLIKYHTSRRLPTMQPPLWQRRYWEHTVRDGEDFRRHLDYVHYNPVRHGYVRMPEDWPYSSLHRAIARGLYPRGWGASEPDTIRTGRWRE